MKKILTSIAILFATSGLFAQLDSIFNIPYPYTKKVIEIDSRDGIMVSFLQLEDRAGKKYKYCRITTTPLVRIGGVAKSGTPYSTILDKAGTEKLAEKLSDMFVWAGETKAITYTERVDLLRTDISNVELSMYSSGNGKPFTLAMDTDRILSRGHSSIGLKEVPRIAAAIKKALEMF